MQSPVPLLALASLAGVLFSAGPSLAAWPNGPTVGVPLTTAAGDQSYVRGRDDTIIPDGAGGAILVWHDLGLDSANEVGVYIQRVLADGSRPWGANGVPICVLDSFQVYPSIVSDGAGGVIVTWIDGRGGTFDIYAQRVNSSGVKLWAVNGVPVSAAPGNQVVPTPVSDGAGGAIIAWHDFRSGTTSDIYAQRINASGVVQWAVNGVALCTAANYQFEPRIVSDGAGGAIVAWYDDRSGNSDIYVRRISGAGTPLWTANGVPLCTAANAQRDQRMVSDGAGGAIVTWYDERGGSGFADIYAQRVTSLGVASWAPNGVAVCNATSNQLVPAIVSDGAGGAIVTWSDTRSISFYDIYAQRLNGAGTPQWTANGIAVCTATNNQYSPSIVADGSGGAIVTWEDSRTDANDVYARRVSSAGVAQWTADGVAMSTAAGEQFYPILASNQAGGAIVVWQDMRNGNVDLFAQHVDANGFVGDPPPPPPPIRPVIDAVSDVANDQGGRVMVMWRFDLDQAPAFEVASYTLWRRLLTTSAPAAVLSASTVPGPGSIRVTPGVDGAQAEYWEFIATVPARGAPGYAYMVSTGSDSLPGSIPWNVFFVEAAASDTFYVSAADSGYSVDNLSPSMPAQLTGNSAAGVTHLHWSPNPEGDLFGYRLYRGSSAAFVPGPGNRIAAPSDTGYTDAGTGHYYKLSAVDVHGNESPHALLLPPSTTDVGPGVPAVLSLAMASSNPARSQIRLRYSLPGAGEARLTVHDVAGRKVRVLEAGLRPAGDHAAQWDGRDAAGRSVESGVYLVRLVANGGSVAVRCVLLN